MAISPELAARILIENTPREITNIDLQKMLYISHMFHLGRYNEPLIDIEDWQAWDYGPVLPSLYRLFRPFGADNLFNFFNNSTIDKNSTEYKIIVEWAKKLSAYTGGQLVSITHNDEGAWARYYQPNVKGIVIPMREILAEYNRVFRNQAAS